MSDAGELVYVYLNATVPKADLADVRRHLTAAAGDAVRDAGGVYLGAALGAGSIGWSDDEVVAMAAVPPDAIADAATVLLGSAAGRATVTLERLAATARPTEARRIEPAGVIAHRAFALASPADAEELVALSAEAWPAFEDAYDAWIEGLFHSLDNPDRMLLVTRYASFAEWERSREVRLAADGDLAEARQRFVRRQQLTRRQIVRVAAAV